MVDLGPTWTVAAWPEHAADVAEVAGLTPSPARAIDR